MQRWLRLAQLGLLGAFAASASNCSSTNDSDCGPRPVFSCARCGSDWLHEAECSDGKWTCPDDLVFTNTCPDGTCFGPPVSCCGPNGERSAGICHVSESSPAPSGGPCPKGWVSCFTLVDSGTEPVDSAFDIDGALGECLEMDYSCAFCCGKYHFEAMEQLFASLRPCACPSACKAECSYGFCDDTTMSASGACEACLLAQLEPDAACATGVCDSAECAAYLGCLDSCGP